MIKWEIENIIPKVEKFKLNSIKEGKVTYLGAAGFEDRSLELLQQFKDNDISIHNCIGIEYLPYDNRNQRNEFNSLMNEVTKKQKEWITYDRYNPEKHLSEFKGINKISKGTRILLDISSMSKLLIVNLIYLLRSFKGPISIIYCEAEVYHPLEDEYRTQIINRTIHSPAFLTSDVYKVIISRFLAGSDMQGKPIFLIAFPTFNRLEMIALLDEIIPEKILLFKGIPHKEDNHWRLSAITQLNKEIEKDVLYNVKDIERLDVKTFDFTNIIKQIEEKYIRNRATHACMISPTGSKFQGIGVTFFKMMHPDVHIIYPITKKFASKYTEGVEEIWEIRFDNFLNFFQRLDSYRWRDIEDLNQIITNWEKLE